VKYYSLLFGRVEGYERVGGTHFLCLEKEEEYNAIFFG